MSDPPVTALRATPEEEADIRRRVREVDPTSLGPDRVIAVLGYAAALARMLADPRVSDPIYDLPRPITEASVRAWIEETAALQAAGEAILILSLDEEGEVAGYSRFSIWPDRSSAELAGATRADRQNRGQGTAGAARSFGWMFEVLGVRLIGLTAALDNVRSARVIEAAGFRPMGERDSRRPDGTVRRSRYWEMTVEDWRRARVSGPEDASS
ncbi:GNAT family protein [Phenylobacterium sp.]|uniref:GNAT family N-acetyltransferase n=1 Tax=Phenylobacterium sp. TaxID=1871053 RepID=UPI0025D07815|nr:GNAT family protein [Phenylobacterium sp.]MCA3740746.1 GNAT family N-acetyltransferase [Phenylobacterium sp.]